MVLMGYSVTLSASEVSSGMNVSLGMKLRAIKNPQDGPISPLIGGEITPGKPIYRNYFIPVITTVGAHFLHIFSCFINNICGSHSWHSNSGIQFLSHVSCRESTVSVKKNSKDIQRHCYL